MSAPARTEPGTNVTKRERSETFRHSLSKFEPTLVSVLPNYIKPERMIALTLTAATKNPKLFDCSMESVALSLIQVAQWDLEIGRTAHLVPFGTTCTAIADWKGLVELMIRSGHVKSVKARAVYSKEHFRLVEGLREDIEHIPDLNSATRGDLMAFYALAHFARGGGTWEVMTKEDVETIRSRANSKNSDAWRNHFVEMGKKTAIRRLAKRMPQTPALQSALSTDDRLDTGELLDAIRREEHQFAPSRIQGVQSTPQRSLAPVTQLPLNDPTDGYSGPQYDAAPIRSESDERPEARSSVAAPRTPAQVATARNVAATSKDPYEDGAADPGDDYVDELPDDAEDNGTPAASGERQRYAIEEVSCPFGESTRGRPLWQIATADLENAVAFIKKNKTQSKFTAFFDAAQSVIQMRQAKQIPEPTAEDLTQPRPAPMVSEGEGK